MKSKHKAQVISAFDLDADGVPELISGWNTGKFEARKEANGKLVYKDNVHSSVSAILQVRQGGERWVGVQAPHDPV